MRLRLRRPALLRARRTTGQDLVGTEKPLVRVAVAVGFEPTEELPPHTLSRRAPSAARTRHRGRGYRSDRSAGKSVVLAAYTVKVA